MDMRDRRQSGQILVIAILVISLVLLSTQVYIFEVGKSLEVVEPALVNDFVFATKVGSKHVVTGSLANISIGGRNLTLLTNLERWVTFIESLYQYGKPLFNCTLRITPPYVNGTYLSWGSNGVGVSSACADLNLSLVDSQVTMQMDYTINVTTSLRIEGVYRVIQDNIKQLNVTINLSNEGRPALARNIKVLYEYLGEWRIPNFQETDYGNGTYLISFEAEIPEDDFNISAQVYDLRGIYVQANTTCTSIS